MPMRLRRSRNTRRVKRTFGRKKVIAVMLKKSRRPGPAQPVQYFKRTLYLSADKSSSTVQVIPFALNFKLSQIPNATEFTSLYDQYCIKGIKYSLIPRMTETDSTQQNLPNIGSCIDQDDATAPAPASVIDTLTQYQNFKLTRGNRIHSRYWKPSVVNEVFNSLVSTGYGPKKNAWIDCNSPDVPHYGLKYFIQQTAVAVTFDVKIDFYIAFKNVR